MRLFPVQNTLLQSAIERNRQKLIHSLFGVAFGINPLWIGAFLIVAVAIAADANAAADLPRESDVSGKRRLVVCIPSDVASLDPTNHRSRITQMVLKHLFDGLTTRDGVNRLIPQLAVSWRLMNDTLWQFNLRKGVRFHNGDAFSATDVKFTLDRVSKTEGMDGRTSPRQSLFEPISEVTVIDDYTIQIKTRYPWPNLPRMLALQEIVPARYIQTLGIEAFLSRPVGTGPFRLIQADPAGELRLERFADYYGESNRKPSAGMASVEQLIFKVMPSQLDQIAMLKAGQCDIISNFPSESVPLLAMSSGIQIVKVPATKSFFAEINCVKPPFDDVRIRQALNFAVDVPALVQHELQGHGVALATILLPNAFGVDPTLHPYPYQPELARELLAASAYPRNRPVTVYCNRDDVAFADTIAFFLTKLGLTARVRISSSYRPQITGADAPWDIFVGSWGNSTLDPAGILIPKLKSRAHGNFSGYGSPQLDDLMMAAQSTMDDGRRADGYHRIQKIIFQEAPMIFGYAPDEFYALGKRVGNFVPPVTGMMDLRDIYLNEGN
jgi:peptide/nickel transport system substrate-binding protein